MTTPSLDIPVVETPVVENTSHNNNTSTYKEVIEKEDNKKETILTTNLSIRTYVNGKSFLLFFWHF